VLFFNAGGNSFETSIIKQSNASTFEVLAVLGSNKLGGRRFDDRLVDYFIKQKENYRKDMCKLREACETAKKVLSTKNEASVFGSMITRDFFEFICSDLFGATVDMMRQVLKDAKIKKAQVQEVVMTGGSFRIPKMGKLIINFFDGYNTKLSYSSVDTVSSGAARHAAVLLGKDSTRFQEVKVFDVLPISLGTAIDGTIMDSIIVKNSKIPCSFTKVYIPVQDYQTEVDVKVYEGEKHFVADNNFLGNFILSNLTPTFKKKKKIDVTFSLNSDGILVVNAKEQSKDNEKEIKIDILCNGTLTEAEVNIIRNQINNP
jgi:heat shock 70kDa protein 1/2/6/8